MPLRLASGLLVALLATPASGQQGGLPPFEEPPTLDARVILRPEFASGPHFTVRPPVPTYAGHNQFEIDSDFGVFTAAGNTELGQRLREIAAIAQLRELEKSTAYKDALVQAAKGPVQLAKNLATHPVDTISGVPKGIWKMLNGAGQALKEVSQERPASPYEDSYVKDAIGFGAVKRQIAARLGVDPYSTNEEFQRELNGVAWTAYGGKMTFAGALAPLGGVAGIAVKSVNASGAALSALRDLAPTDLRRRNLGLLLAMGISRDDANSFLNNPSLSPTHQTLIVDALDSLGGVAGRDNYVRLAAASTDETDAICYQRSAQLIALLHRTTPLEVLSSHRGLPLALARDGTLLVPLEWDYAAWTPAAADFISAIQAGRIGDRTFKGFHVYLTGVASEATKTALAASGIALTERALPGPLR